MADKPGIRRALALFSLGLRVEGHREWIWTIRQFDDRQLLAAADVARRNELFDRAINTADRTQNVHDFTLRYLAPYREVLDAAGASARPGRSVGLRPYSPGKPLHRRRAFARGGERTHAAHAGHGEVGRAKNGDEARSAT